MLLGGRLGRLRVCACCVFGETHLDAGGLEQLFGRFAVAGEDGHADAGAGLNAGSEEGGGFAKFCGEAVQDPGGLTGCVYILENDNKLIAAKACNGLSAAGDGAQTGCGDEKQLIASVVTEGVIHVFEVVEIEAEDGDGGSVAPRLFECQIQLGKQEAAIGKAGERVVVGGRLRLVFRCDLRGHIVLNSHEVSEVSSVVADGVEMELIPEEGSILTVVAQDNPSILAPAKSRPNFSQCGLIRIGALKEPAVASADFAGGVAGHALEGGIDVGKGKVREMGVRDGDAVGHAIQDAAVVIEVVDHGAVALEEGMRHAGSLLERGGGRLQLQGAVHHPRRSGIHDCRGNSGRVWIADLQKGSSVVGGEAAAVRRLPWASWLVGNDERQQARDGWGVFRVLQVDGTKPTGHGSSVQEVALCVDGEKYANCHLLGHGVMIGLCRDIGDGCGR